MLSHLSSPGLASWARSCGQWKKGKPENGRMSISTQLGLDFWNRSGILAIAPKCSVHSRPSDVYGVHMGTFLPQIAGLWIRLWHEYSAIQGITVPLVVGKSWQCMRNIGSVLLRVVYMASNLDETSARLLCQIRRQMLLTVCLLLQYTADTSSLTLVL